MIELCCEYLSVWCFWLYVLFMSRSCFKGNPHSIVARMSRNSLLEIGVISEVYMTAMRLEHNQTNTQPFSQTGQMIELYCEYLSGQCIWLYVLIYRTHLRVYPHSSCLNVKDLLTRNRCEILSLSSCNETQTHNQFVHKWTLKHLAKLVKWLS